MDIPVNNNIPLVSSVFIGVCSGIVTPSVPGSPIDGASTLTTSVSIPSGNWVLGDCKVTYIGDGGVYNYYSYTKYTVDSAPGNYIFFPIINGTPDFTNTNIVYIPFSGTETSATVGGSRVFSYGDVLQVGLDAQELTGEMILPSGVSFSLNSTA